MNAIKKMIRPVRAYYHRRSELKGMEVFPIHQERLIYPCPLDDGKRKNLARQAANRSLLGFSELAKPHILHVGVTTLCNLHCPACPTGTASLGREGEHLDFDLFCRTVDGLRSSLLFMLFWDWGEPLLHPRLADMVEYAGRSGIRTVISTNGNVVYSPAKLEKLILAQPATVIVCVDGADQETYQTYRTGGRLETVLQTIRRMVEIREKKAVALPLIEFRSLATAGTERQMPELLKLAQESGADLFSVKTLRPYNYRGDSVDNTLVPENDTLSRYHYKEDQREQGAREDFVSTGPLTCAKPLYAPTLNSDGVLAFCSYAQKPEEFFGNLSGSSFSNVWKGLSSRRKRMAFLKEGGTPSCRTCYFRSEPRPTIIHQVPLRPLPEGMELEAAETPEEFLSRF